MDNVQGSPTGQDPTMSQLDAEAQALMAKKGWKSPAEALKAYAEAERRMAQAITESEQRRKALEAWELWDNDLNAPVAPGQVPTQSQPEPVLGGPAVNEDERQRQYRQNFGWTMPYGVAEEQYPVLGAVSDMLFAMEQRLRAPIEQERRWDKQKRGLRSRPEYADFGQLEADVDALHEENPNIPIDIAYLAVKGRRVASGTSQPAAQTPEDLAAKERAARAMSAGAELAGATQSRGVEPDTVNIETIEADPWRAQRIREAGDARYNLQQNIREGGTP